MEVMPETIDIKDLDFSFAEEVASQPGGENIRKCFACGTCVAGCPISEIDPAYSPRRIIRQILFGMRDAVLKSPTIWYCLVCYRCYARCPQKVNFTDIMRALRYLAIKGHYAPADIIGRIGEIDTLAQTARHHIVRSDLSNQGELLRQFKEWLKEKVENGNPA
ncbi:4Fe-4S dicluster domain-containing protein [candidate division WOR-3 bacterium]|nr:4Fe-4S dicluster domain-containing protein [candidate division WOR-3 bacterium]